MEEQVIIEFIPDTTQLDKTLNEIGKGINDELGKAGGGKDFLKGVAQGIAEETKEVEKLKKSVDNLTKSEVAANKEIDKFAKSMNQLSQGIAGGAIKQGTDNIVKIGNAATKTASETTKLTTQLRAVREQLGRLDEGSDEFIKLSIEAGKLQDRIGDVSQRIRALSSDTFAIDAVVDSARAVAGAFSIAQGAAALFGDENQDLQKALLKVQGSLAVLNGLQETANFITGQSAGKLALLSAAQKTYTFITNGATLAAKAFNLALVGLGAGAVIAGIIYLVSKLREGKEEIEGQGVELDKNIERFKELRKVAEEYVRSLTPAITDVNLLLNQLKVSADNIISPESEKTLKQLAELSDNYFGSLKAGISTYKEAADAARAFKDAVAIESEIASARKELEDLTAEFTNLKKQVDAGTLVSFERINSLSFNLIPKAQEEVEKLNKKLENIGGSTAVGVKKATTELQALKKEIKEAGESITPLPRQESDGINTNKLIDVDAIEEGLKRRRRVADRVAALEEEERQKSIQAEKEKQRIIQESAIQAAEQTFQFLFELGAQRRQQELAEDLAVLDRKRQAELSNKELTDAQRLAIDKKYAAQERQLRIKAFNAEKQAKIASAFINGALAITNILATVPPVIPGTIIPNPQYAASLALAGITTALQIATISAQKPPAFKKGTKGAKQSAMSLVGEEGAELMYVPQGAKIVPHSETMKVLSGHPDTNEILSRFNIPVSSPKLTTLKKEFNGYDFSRLEKAISKNNARFPQVNMDKNGIVTIVNEENSSRTYYGQRYSSR